MNKSIFALFYIDNRLNRNIYRLPLGHGHIHIIRPAVKDQSIDMLEIIVYCHFSSVSVILPWFLYVFRFYDFIEVKFPEELGLFWKYCDFKKLEHRDFEG